MPRKQAKKPDLLTDGERQAARLEAWLHPPHGRQAPRTAVCDLCWRRVPVTQGAMGGPFWVCFECVPRDST